MAQLGDQILDIFGKEIFGKKILGPEFSLSRGPISYDGLVTLGTRMAQEDNCDPMQKKLVINHSRLAHLINKESHDPGASGFSSWASDLVSKVKFEGT